MNIVIQDLRADHHSFARVLRFLKTAKPETTDEGCWEGALLYMQTYPQQAHHPVEDLVFETFVNTASPDSVDRLDRLREEHKSLNQKIKRIDEITQSDGLAALSAESAFRNLVDNYCELRIAHMRYEEESVYPLVETALSINDWKVILRESPNIPDPLFGETPQEAFKELKTAIVELESQPFLPLLV